MLTRRRLARLLLAGTAAALAVTGLAGCRTSPNVAAYVGGDEVTVTQLQAAVDQRLENKDVATAVKGKETAFTRQVLGLLVTERVYAAAADRYHVQVGDDEVRDRITQLLGDNDPEAVYAQLAAQGIGREDVFENVRQQLLRQRIAATKGLADDLSTQALQARYAEVKNTLAQYQLGYITVPDQATADAVLAQLTANPSSYPTLAAQYAGQYTLPAVEARSADQVPGPLTEAVSAAPPGTGFTLAVPQTGGVVVGFVAGLAVPSFEEVRPQLEQEASKKVDDAAKKLIQQVQDDLDVTVNPRYGVLKDGSIVESDGGVVDILSGSGSQASASGN